jgi:hypothetical protein
MDSAWNVFRYSFSNGKANRAKINFQYSSKILAEMDGNNEPYAELLMDRNSKNDLTSCSQYFLDRSNRFYEHFIDDFS